MGSAVGDALWVIGGCFFLPLLLVACSTSGGEGAGAAGGHGAQGGNGAGGDSGSGGGDDGGTAGTGGVSSGGSNAGATAGAGGSNSGGMAGAGDTGGTSAGSAGDGGSGANAGAAGSGDSGGSGGLPIWQPSSSEPIHWHWQLSDTFEQPRDVRTNVSVYDIDGELTEASTVAALHALGSDVKVICYFDAGVYEDYRSDKDRFPKSIIGKADAGWPGSFWLDIRQLDILMPILRDRMVNWCKNKGFDAIEPDETEVWSNDSGFPITKEQNNAFHRAISDMAHSLGLSVGLKGNNTEAAELEPHFDWALTEQCWEYDECENFRDSFIAKGKAVFSVEYDSAPNCELANSWHLNSCQRDLDLVGPTNSQYLYEPCIPDTQDTWN